jgi:transcriptional regulator with XRE-family HTH domain
MIGEKIKNLVKSSSKPKEDVASFIGVSVSNLYELYKKNSVETKYVEKLSEFFDVPIMYFFSDSENLVTKKNNNVVGYSQGVNIANEGGVKVGECVGVDLYERLLLEKEKQLVAKDSEIEFLRSMVKQK